MALNIEIVNIGSLANDGTGDPLRVAFTKLNNNFSQITGVTASGPAGALQYKEGDFTSGSSSLVFDPGLNQLNITANIVPYTYSNVNIGNVTNTINGLYLNPTSLHIGNISVVESENTLSFPVTGSAYDKASLSGLQDIAIVGNSSIAGSSTLGNSFSKSFTITTHNDNPSQALFSTPATNFTTAIAKITTINPDSNNTQYVTLSISKQTDNSQARHIAHSTVFSTVPQTRYDVDINYGNLRVMVNPLANVILNHIVEITLNN
jgi:hypothetical protein